MIVCLFGILHFFNLDPLGFKKEISQDDYSIFVSTIGNINTYGISCTSYGASAVMFATENRDKAQNMVLHLYDICIHGADHGSQ